MVLYYTISILIYLLMCSCCCYYYYYFYYYLFNQDYFPTEKLELELRLARLPDTWLPLAGKTKRRNPDPDCFADRKTKINAAACCGVFFVLGYDPCSRPSATATSSASLGSNSVSPIGNR